MVIYKCVTVFEDSRGLFYPFCKTCIERKILTLLSQNKERNYTFMSFDEEIQLNEDFIVYNEVMENHAFKELLEIKQIGVSNYAKSKEMSVKQVYNHIFKLKKRIKNKSCN